MAIILPKFVYVPPYKIIVLPPPDPPPPTVPLPPTTPLFDIIPDELIVKFPFTTRIKSPPTPNPPLPPPGLPPPGGLPAPPPLLTTVPVCVH